MTYLKITLVLFIALVLFTSCSSGGETVANPVNIPVPDVIEGYVDTSIESDSLSSYFMASVFKLMEEMLAEPADSIAYEKQALLFCHFVSFFDFPPHGGRGLLKDSRSEEEILKDVEDYIEAAKVDSAMYDNAINYAERLSYLVGCDLKTPRGTPFKKGAKQQEILARMIQRHCPESAKRHHIFNGYFVIYVLKGLGDI